MVHLIRMTRNYYCYCYCYYSAEGHVKLTNISRPPWQEVVLVKLAVAQLAKKYPAFYIECSSPPLVPILH